MSANQFLYSAYLTKSYGLPGADIDLVTAGDGNSCRIIAWSGGDIVVVNGDDSLVTIPEAFSPWTGQFKTIKSSGSGTAATSILVGW